MQFLDQELPTGEKITPESMAAGNVPYIIFFLEGLQSLNHSVRSSRANLNNMPLQHGEANRINHTVDVAGVDITQGALTSSIPTNHDRYRPVSDMSQQMQIKVSPMKQEARVLLTSEGSKMNENSDMKQGISMRGFEPQTEQPSVARR